MPESGNIKWTASIPSKGTIIYDICNKTYKNLKLRLKIQITKKSQKSQNLTSPKTLNFKWERALWTLNGVSSRPPTTSHISNMYKRDRLGGLKFLPFVALVVVWEGEFVFGDDFSWRNLFFSPCPLTSLFCFVVLFYVSLNSYLSCLWEHFLQEHPGWNW